MGNWPTTALRTLRTKPKAPQKAFLGALREEEEQA